MRFGSKTRHAAPACGVAMLVLSLCLGSPAWAQPRGGAHWTPDSNLPQPGESGHRARTNLHVLLLDRGASVAGPAGAPVSGDFYETPASIACIYRLAAEPSGVAPACDPNVASGNPAGGSRAIAIVDAYDDPTAAADLNVFSAQFGLAAANFQQVYASGTKPAYKSGWALEESLDIEWAHAMAPGAQIILVEAASNSFTDLFNAVQVAVARVQAAGGGEVSMSWGSSEFSNELSYDGNFSSAPGVVFIAATGDAPGVEYPSVSPYVIAAGGVSAARNPATGAFEKDSAWQQAGGGPSLYEPRPAFQNAIAAIVGSQRGTPDIAFDADPDTGVWVYDSSSGTGIWYIVGGTSVAAPSLAGIINAAGGFATSSAIELAKIYAAPAGFRDVASGNCGPYGGYLSVGKWDFCTGLGRPLTLKHK